MRIRVLGCSGAIAQGCRTTAFLLDDDVLIDAGTGVGDLRLDEMARIRHVFLTHSHLDHIAALPLMLDAVALQQVKTGAGPLQVHALPETIATLQTHIFNNVIWPDFTHIPSADAPLLRFVPLQTGEKITAGGKTFEALPAVHTVAAVGFAVSQAAAEGHWVFTGDTGRNPAFWQRINQLPVAMLVIETAFSNHEEGLATSSKHLAPVSLAAELAQIRIAPLHRPYPIYITHTKPAEAAQIMEEIAEQSSGCDPVHNIRWLEAGMQFEL